MKKAKLLWIDLEMTGLDPKKDKICEVAAIATDMDLNSVATYEAVVKIDEKLMQERMVGDFWEKNAASREALQKQNQDGKPIENIERELIEFIGKNCTKELYLAGNSIHQDRKFIEVEMPELNQSISRDFVQRFALRQHDSRSVPSPVINAFFTAQLAAFLTALLTAFFKYLLCFGFKYLSAHDFTDSFPDPLVFICERIDHFV